MRNSFYNGFIDTDDLMPDSENNKIRELSEEGKQQYLEERIRKFEIDAMQQVSFLDGINFREDENTFRKRQTMRQSLKSTPPIIGDVASCIRPEDYLTMA